MNTDKNKYMHISRLGSRLNLSFSGHETIGNKIMAIDGIKRKLLIMDADGNSGKYDIIELDEISKISVKKIFNSIQAGELKKRSLEQFIKNICLQFSFKNKLHAFVLPFYDSKRNPISDAFRLEKKARNWQILLSKLGSLRNHQKPLPETVSCMPAV